MLKLRSTFKTRPLFFPERGTITLLFSNNARQSTVEDYCCASDYTLCSELTLTTSRLCLKGCNEENLGVDNIPCALVILK